MTFLLASDGFDDDGPGHYQQYRTYLEATRKVFPPSAFALASSDWYHSFNDHRCPHDAWLESVTIGENSFGERHEKRSTSITVRLLGAYHDGYIELVYPKVYSYKFDLWQAENGHQDWRYDELRVSDSGRLLHEIEWCALSDTGRWLIEASDLEFRWLPKMKTHRIYFDGNEIDEDGRVNLGVPGAVRDIELIGPELRDGHLVLLYNDEGQEMWAVIHYDATYKHWMARPIPETLTNRE